MSRAGAIRRIVSAAALGGGGITALGVATYGFLLAEAVIARKTVGRPHGDNAPEADGLYGSALGPGPVDAPDEVEPIRMVLLGDSTAAGLGLTDPRETPGALIAEGLAAVAERPVRLTNVARSGSVSADLRWQVRRALIASPDIAVIFIGANDVTTRVPPARAVRDLRNAVRRLREAGAEVVVGTCPDLGTVEPIAQPLRWLARRWSRQLAAAQTVAVVEEGGRTVAFADLLGPEFESSPKEMFGPDRFHPSAQGYAQAAYAVLPSVGAALGVWPEAGEHRPDPTRGEGVLPIYVAAAEAAEAPGTEVAATRIAGRSLGPRGRWAMLLRRRRGVPAVEHEDDEPETVPNAT
ncbi:SGNH/GDSL hydrolase family protein [Bailinhaonella thermotolerans]|uniref:SGNH/GDSL hydrolase family protein n=1 Tax=Bailinhaonella thermotolerans TaxID=1070861 RepID=A0A3A4AY25_9ACTN|nr:SGNH/GDSL hydrolase family protein [Bailinhaonella thermotolerans]RJL33309.1 SGNH/GDSL hydrolase family protein [Bailinhaonella thermotolerans]